MRAISRFESNLMQILHCLLGRAPLERARPLLSKAVPRPRCLSRDSVDLICDALTKGCVSVLARAGWRRERFLRSEQPVEGRLWERSPTEELGLSFSQNTLAMLIWMTEANTAQAKARWRPGANVERTVGDDFLGYLAYSVLRNSRIGDLWMYPPLCHNALCQLAYAEDFARWEDKTAADFAPWMTGTGACILEALQGELATRWLEMEQAKSRVRTTDQMHWIGVSQERTLDAFLDAAEASGRRDLARFLLDAASRLLAAEPAPETWHRTLDVANLRMADRAARYGEAFAFLRSLRRLAQWQQHAIHTGFMDEDYAASQLWKADWERFGGEHSVEVAQRIVRSVDPLSQPPRDANTNES